MYRQPRLTLNAKAPVSILRRALSRNRNPIPKLTIPYGRHLSFRQVRTPNRELNIFSRLNTKDAKKIYLAVFLLKQMNTCMLQEH